MSPSPRANAICLAMIAEAAAAGRMKHHPSMAGLARRNAKGVAAFTGEVRFNEGWLTQPLRWRKPMVIFVCSRGDLFHDDVPDEWIDRVFAVMALCPQHFFRVLTKRPERMRRYLATSFETGGAFDRVVMEMMAHTDLAGYPSIKETCEAYRIPWVHPRSAHDWWPLANVGVGASFHDQPSADEVVPLVLDTPAAMRFVSAEPLHGAADLTRICIVPQKPGSIRAGIHVNALAGRYCESGLTYTGDWDITKPAPDLPARKIDEVLTGGESGKHASSSLPHDFRFLRDQCASAETAFYFKQWGSFAPVEIAWADFIKPKRKHVGEALVERHGDRCTVMRRMAKKKAGAMLDGREHRAVAPQVTAHFERIGRVG